METFSYPLVCWKLDENHVCGHLVGCGYEVIGANSKKIISLLEDWIQKKWSEHWLPEPLESWSLKTVKVKFRPSYKEKDGVYPSPTEVTLSVSVVHGLNKSGYYECFIPLLNRHFYFYEKDQLIDLVRHFVKDFFSSAPPEEVHRYFSGHSPWLEKIIVRVKTSEKTFSGENSFQNSYDSLSGIAERFPPTKSLRQKLQAAPEMVWEQSEMIGMAVEKILKEQISLLFVGEPGVGKSAILSEVIRHCHHDSVQKKSQQKLYFWKTSPHRMVARAKYLGEWQEICEEIVEALEMSHGILWMADFMSLFQMGGESVEDSMAAFLMPYLNQGKIKIVAEMTPAELDSARRIFPSFMQNFQVLFIPEMEEPKVFKILSLFQNHSRNSFQVEIEQKALEVAYRLLKRYLPYESFPGKALRFLSQCLKEAHLQERKEISTHHVIETFAEKTGMAEIFLRDDLLMDKKDLEDFFSRQIKGQKDALEKICQVVKIFKAGLNNPGKPISTMLFTGPTGVGKTATARTLAKYFFGQGQKKDPLIRLDMSEFQYPGQIERLIGSRGRSPGKLVQQIRERPFSVVLFDEIEKAHSSLFDILLSVLDEGRLVDAYGRITDFRNTILILTSNLGSSQQSLSGFSGEVPKDWEGSVRSFFRPEFYNRLDFVVSFHPLDSSAVYEIIEKELEELKKREGFDKRKIQLLFTPAVVDLLFQEGFDPVYGARPLQRAMERQVVSALAKYLLEDSKARECTLKVDWQEEKVTVQKNLGL